MMSLGASSQSFRTGYFLDNYIYGYRINPAQVNDRSSLGLFIGNFDLQNASSVGVSSFLFPNPDGSSSLVTGLNKAISTDKFLGGLKNHNFVSLDENINLFALGLSDGRRMHTIEVNTRVMGTASIPKSVFSLLKSGKTGTYDFNGLYADASALADICYGYSTVLGENLSVGGRFHLLFGLANLNFRSRGSSVTMDEKAIVAGADMQLNASGMIGFHTNEDGGVDMRRIEFSPTPFGSLGATLDLGCEYKSDFGLDAMVSITDFGAISWNNKLSAQANASVEFKGFFSEGGNIKTDLDDLLDLNNALDYRVIKGRRGLRMMPCNIAAGARYQMPFWSGMTVGMLNTCHIGRASSWFETRIGVTATPVRIVSVTANLGLGTMGPTWGTAVNLHLGPVNIIAGADSFLSPLGKLKSTTFPINSFVENVHLGISFTFN